MNEIVTLMSEVCDINSIRTDKYELTSPDELAEVKEDRIESLTVIADDGRTVLSLRKWFPFFESERSDLQMRGFVTELEKIARRCRRVPLYFNSTKQVSAYSLVLLAFVALLSVIVTLLPHSSDKMQKTTLLEWAVVVLGAAAGTVIQYFTIGPQMPSAVLLTRTRAEAPPWIKRNKDALVTNAIVSAVFLVLGVVIGRLTSS